MGYDAVKELIDNAIFHWKIAMRGNLDGEGSSEGEFPYYGAPYSPAGGFYAVYKILEPHLHVNRGDHSNMGRTRAAPTYHYSAREKKVPLVNTLVACRLMGGRGGR
jgi:hypothetical protein